MANPLHGGHGARQSQHSTFNEMLHLYSAQRHGDAVKTMVCPLVFSKSAQMIHVINATSGHDSLILVLKKKRQIAAFSVLGVCVCV